MLATGTLVHNRFSLIHEMGTSLSALGALQSTVYADTHENSDHFFLRVNIMFPNLRTAEDAPFYTSIWSCDSQGKKKSSEALFSGPFLTREEALKQLLVGGYY